MVRLIAVQKMDMKIRIEKGLVIILAVDISHAGGYGIKLLKGNHLTV